MALYLMSTTVIPGGANGLWRMTAVTADCARELVQQHEFTSAVGHASTAEVMSEILRTTVEANRLTVVPQEGDHFLCFRLNSRPPEGAILDRGTLEAIGFEFCLLSFEEADNSRPLDRVHLGSWEEFHEHIRWEQPPSA